MEKAEYIFNQEKQYIVGLSGSARRFGRALDKGRGCFVYDADGKKYLDFTAGVGIMSTGHCHPYVVRRIKQQLDRFVGWHDAATEPRAQLLSRLAHLLPKKLRHICLFSSGAETVEAALRFARRHTGRSNVVCFTGGFHGKTLGALSVSGHDSLKCWWTSNNKNSYTLPYADCYRCPYDLDRKTCGVACSLKIKKMLKAVSDLPAAIIIEPMQGTQGNIIPPREFLKAIQNWCIERNVLLICDEILVGCGRTGSFLASEQFGLTPDFILLGKGLASGYPVGALAVSDEIFSSAEINWVSASSSSFGGNPVAATAADATVKVICEENLISNAQHVGRYLLEELGHLSEKYPFFKNIRGRGLFIGVDLIPTEWGGQRSQALGELIVSIAAQNGLLLMSSNGSLRINPPLCLTKQEAQEGVTLLSKTLEAVFKSSSKEIL